MPDAVRRRDVFICFSKARPGEAQVALALKDQLEQLGIDAFEYEDWRWVAQSVPGDEPDVDRATLRHMLTTSSVVVLISPHQGEASSGVQTEIAELRSCASPVILLHWSPAGWHPLDDPPQLAGLNLVWHYEGRSVNENNVAQNACEHIARELATAAWLACQIHSAQARHPRAAARLLERIPEQPADPLLNFQLAAPAAPRTTWDDPADADALDKLAASVAADATTEDLRTFVNEWRGGADLMTQTLADETRFALRRPLKTLHAAFEALCRHACRLQPALSNLSDGTLHLRGLMLARLDRPDEAVPLLQQALRTAPREKQFELHQAMALALQESDPQAAISSFTHAIACAPLPEIACTLTYNRGVLRSNIATEYDAAMADFSFVAEDGENSTIRHSALRARARLRAKKQDYDGAIADYTQILDEAAATPRTAVSAWMDRGAVYHTQGRYAEAIADWTHAIDAADATQQQRFRALEARAQTLDKSGQYTAAADDYEAMARFSAVAPAYTEQLRQTAKRLRGSQ